MAAPLSFRLVATTCVAAFVAGAAPAYATESCSQPYRIARGDTLESIAAHCGTTVGDIMRVNKRIEDPVILPVGYALQIPRSADALPSNPVYWNSDRDRNRDGTRANLRRIDWRNGSYIVRRGDTLGDIAAAANVSVRSLLSANPQLRDPDRLYAGEVLRLPSGAVRDGYASYRDRPGPGNPSGFQNIGYTSADFIAYADDGPSYGGEYLKVGEQISVEGVVTPEGNKCAAVRNAAGRLFTLTSTDHTLSPGDRVRVEGRIAPADWCSQGISVAVTTVEYDLNRDGNYRNASYRESRAPAPAVVVLRDDRDDRRDRRDDRRRDDDNKPSDFKVTDTDRRDVLPPVGRTAFAPGAPKEVIRGTITKEGRDCTTVRAFDGTIYGIPARLTSVGFGEGIEITGVRAASQCREGITFVAEQARKL